MLNVVKDHGRVVVFDASGAVVLVLACVGGRDDGRHVSQRRPNVAAKEGSARSEFEGCHVESASEQDFVLEYLQFGRFQCAVAYDSKRDDGCDRSIGYCTLRSRGRRRQWCSSGLVQG